MEEESIRTVDGFTLSAISHRVASDNVVVWLHGITVDKDEYLGFFRDGADWLAKHGIASLRFDFRGHGGQQWLLLGLLGCWPELRRSCGD